MCKTLPVLMFYVIQTVKKNLIFRVFIAILRYLDIRIRFLPGVTIVARGKPYGGSSARFQVHT